MSINFSYRRVEDMHPHSLEDEDIDYGDITAINERNQQSKEFDEDTSEDNEDIRSVLLQPVSDYSNIMKRMGHVDRTRQSRSIHVHGFNLSKISIYGSHFFLVVIIFVLLFILGNVSRADLLRRIQSISSFASSKISPINPYDLHGVLLVNTSVGHENKWEPIDSNYRPVDYMRMLTEADPSSDIEFVRGKSIVLFGDSIDRNHNEHFCINTLGGSFTQLNPGDGIYPPLPAGQELPPPNFLNSIDQTRTWAENDQSFPMLCSVARLEFKILSVFHFGLLEELNPELMTMLHYHPPHRVEDRFEKILLPLLVSLNMTSPAIISFTQGFCSLFRYAQIDRTIREKLLQDEFLTEDDDEIKATDPWRELGQVERSEIQSRLKLMLKRLIEWRGKESPSTKILFRELHHPKLQDSIPFSRVQTINQISLGVVESLYQEDDKTSGKLRQNLGIDHWGSKILGQERHFFDNIHPLRLPNSYLYGNMILQQLKMMST